MDDVAYLLFLRKIVELADLLDQVLKLPPAVVLFLKPVAVFHRQLRSGKVARLLFCGKVLKKGEVVKKGIEQFLREGRIAVGP